MSLIAKICGLKTDEHIAAALSGGAAQIGLMFFEKSPRYITPSDAGVLRQGINAPAQVTAVTVDAPNELLDEIVEKVQPDMLQLHGHESPERLVELRARYGLKLMKVFSIHQPADLARTELYQDVADMLLLDAKRPKGSELPGGNGVAFDWNLLSEFQSNIPVLLSGGINIDNIAEAVTLCLDPANCICGIDVSSGVEHIPGEKNTRLISGLLAEFADLQIRVEKHETIA